MSSFCMWLESDTSLTIVARSAPRHKHSVLTEKPVLLFSSKGTFLGKGCRAGSNFIFMLNNYILKKIYLPSIFSHFLLFHTKVIQGQHPPCNYPSGFSNRLQVVAVTTWLLSMQHPQSLLTWRQMQKVPGWRQLVSKQLWSTSDHCLQTGVICRQIGVGEGLQVVVV